MCSSGGRAERENYKQAWSCEHKTPQCPVAGAPGILVGDKGRRGDANFMCPFLSPLPERATPLITPGETGASSASLRGFQALRQGGHSIWVVKCYAMCKVGQSYASPALESPEAEGLSCSDHVCEDLTPILSSGSASTC